MPDLSPQDLDTIQAKPRKGGALSHLPDLDDVDAVRSWLTHAFRPTAGWRLAGFERMGRGKDDPCALAFTSGRESKVFRFKQQRELMTHPRSAVTTGSDAWLRMPHLRGDEIEDIWVALCTLGRVMTEHDEIEQTHEWIESMLPATLPLTGFSLVPDARHDALMAIRKAGQFGKGDALSMIKGSNGDERHDYQQRPTRFIDAQTGEQWLRSGEIACYLRWVVGVEPLSHQTLRARLHEIGVMWRPFEDYRPPHPKLQLYQLTERLIEYVGNGSRGS